MNEVLLRSLRETLLNDAERRRLDVAHEILRLLMDELGLDPMDGRDRWLAEMGMVTVLMAEDKEAEE